MQTALLVQPHRGVELVPGDVVDIDDDEQLAALARQFIVPMCERDCE